MDKTNIILAEDDTDDYIFFTKTLYQIIPKALVERSKNGLEFITYLKTHEKPGLIFLDLNLPLKSGLECLKFIKSAEGLAHIPVVIFSTSHYIKHIDEAFKNGAHYYIVKPSDANALVEILRVVINRLSESDELPCKQNFVVRSTVTLET